MTLSDVTETLLRSLVTESNEPASAAYRDSKYVSFNMRARPWQNIVLSPTVHQNRNSLMTTAFAYINEIRKYIHTK